MGKCCSKFKYVDRRRVSTGDSSGGGDDTLHSSSRDTSHEQPEEATSEVKPEVESKKVSAGEEEREKSTKEKVTPKDEPCEHKSQEHSDEQKDSCEDNSESEAEVKDTSKTDENRKNKTEEEKRKKNEAAERKKYENQAESKVVEPLSEQIEAVTKIQDVTQPLKQEVKDDHSLVTFLTSCYAETDCSEVVVAITEFDEVCKVRLQFSGACLKRQVSCGQHHFSCIALSGQKQIKGRKDGFFLGLLFPPQHHLQFWKAMWRIQYEHWSLVEERPSLVFSVS
ncbi:hypothetical protein ScPMuIL_005238 [Solemya velum]